MSAPARLAPTVAEIQGALAAISPGPWHWSGYKNRHSSMGPYVATWLPNLGRTTVMDCARLGMRGGQPRFRDDVTGYGMMVDGVDLAIPEVTYRDDIVDMNHPDARFIVAAPGYVRVLLDLIAELEARQAASR